MISSEGGAQSEARFWLSREMRGWAVDGDRLICPRDECAWEATLTPVLRRATLTEHLSEDQMTD
ncbi:hypothetical protein OG232_04585 [Streptomyces sp. NBC_01411]|uniref:hypothetical protein n=1 Tax=Streptomyces sp. NBC_01411 TaxID=2903857 RepID=UPI00325303A7